MSELNRKWPRCKSLRKHTLSFHIPVLRKRELSGSKVRTDDNSLLSEVASGARERRRLPGPSQRWRIDWCCKDVSIFQQSRELLSGHCSLSRLKIGLPRAPFWGCWREIGQRRRSPASLLTPVRSHIPTTKGSVCQHLHLHSSAFLTGRAHPPCQLLPLRSS